MSDGRLTPFDWAALGGLVTLAVVNYLDERRAWAQVKEVAESFAASGVAARVVYGRETLCPRCRGQRTFPKSWTRQPVACDRCQGRGTICDE